MKRSADHYLNHGNTPNNRLSIRPVQCTNRGTHRRAHGTFRGPSTLRRLRNGYRKRFVRGCFNDYGDRCTNPTKTDCQLLPEQDASGWGAVKRSADHYLNHGNTPNNHFFIRPVQCTNRGTHRRAHGTFRGPSTLRRLRNNYCKRFVRGCFNNFRDRCTNPTKTAWQTLARVGCVPVGCGEAVGRSLLKSR